MTFRFNGKKYRWHPEIFLENMATVIGAAVIAMGMGSLIGFWIISML